MIPRHWIRVIGHGRLPVLPGDRFLKAKCPEQLGDGEEHVALGEMDAGADAAAGAVAVMVAALPVTDSVFGREGRVVSEALGNEGRGVGKCAVVHV